MGTRSGRPETGLVHAVHGLRVGEAGAELRLQLLDEAARENPFSLRSFLADLAACLFQFTSMWLTAKMASAL